MKDNSMLNVTRFGTVISLVAFLLYKKYGIDYYFYLGIVLMITSIAFPVILRPLKDLLEKIADFIGRFVSYILIFITFYIILTPVAIIFRFLNSGGINIKNDSNTLWHIREHLFEAKDMEDVF